MGIGANLGDAALKVRWAEIELAALPGIARVRVSSLWRSAPVGLVPEQPWYVNACAELTFRRAPEPVELLAALLAIEVRGGRDRAREVPMGPRPLDLDLLLWGPRVLELIGPPRLHLPHPHLHERAFALAPLVELAGPDVAIPGHGRAGELLAATLADPLQSVAKVV